MDKPNVTDERDIVERLRHCSHNCGDEYLHELTGRAADELTRLRAELAAMRERAEGLAVAASGAMLVLDGFPMFGTESAQRIEALRAALAAWQDNQR